jgi:hypothetical protein
MASVETLSQEFGLRAFAYAGCPEENEPPRVPFLLEWNG